MRHSYHQYRELHYSVPVADVVLIIFVVLKLTGVIDWNWWWVLSPIWIMFAFVTLIFIGSFLYVTIRKTLRKIRKKK